jgi:glyoxylase-like metal-dependent hydrolase (beta-lactamase superfamily II)
MEVAQDVHAVRLIGSNAFLILGDEVMLIDAGHRGSGVMLRRQLGALGHNISEIRRIVCTHGHPDHIGGVQEIARASGAQVLMHPADMERLRIRFRDVITGRPAPGAIIAYSRRHPPTSPVLKKATSCPRWAVCVCCTRQVTHRGASVSIRRRAGFSSWAICCSACADR